jgi:hypothetical protein
VTWLNTMKMIASGAVTELLVTVAAYRGTKA